MKASVHRQLQAVADAAGAEGFAVIRETKHLIVEFWFPSAGATKDAVRLTMSATCSDNSRGLKNQIADLRRARRIQQMGA